MEKWHTTLVVVMIAQAAATQVSNHEWTNDCRNDVNSNGGGNLFVTDVMVPSLIAN